VGERFDFLIKQFSNYEIVVLEDECLAEIINPFCKENIKVYYDSDDNFSPYILCFAFQHIHLCDEEEVVDYINDITSGNLFSIEFFDDGERRFGGDITVDKLKELSYELLEQQTGYLGSTELKDCADSFKVRGWNSENFDAIFVIDENGTVTIRKVN
jgi:hypothetical protein